MAADKTFTVEELQSLKDRSNIHLLIHGKGLLREHTQLRPPSEVIPQLTSMSLLSTVYAITEFLGAFIKLEHAFQQAPAPADPPHSSQTNIPVVMRSSSAKPARTQPKLLKMSATQTSLESCWRSTSSVIWLEAP